MMANISLYKLYIVLSIDQWTFSLLSQPLYKVQPVITWSSQKTSSKLCKHTRFLETEPSSREMSSQFTIGKNMISSKPQTNNKTCCIYNKFSCNLSLWCDRKGFHKSNLLPMDCTHRASKIAKKNDLSTNHKILNL